MTDHHPLTVDHQPGRPAIVTVPARTPAAGWLVINRAALRAIVTRLGAVVVRGLEISDAPTFDVAGRIVADRLMTEREPFAPRPAYPGAIYASTTWPADQPMCMHHELSYARDVPGLVLFGCLVAPAGGGSIALADAAAVVRDLPPTLVERFAQQGWQLDRSHNDIVGVPWPEAFGVTTRAEVEDYCRDNDIEWSWEGDNELRTRRRRPAVAAHPVTGQRIWFNQIAFLNEWTMEPAVREYLRLEFGPAGLPFNTGYGDGAPVDEATVSVINEVYAAHAVRDPLQAGDLYLVDNVRTAHGRDPYTGPREVLVAFADPVSVPAWSD